jgi:PQ loop repeat
MGYLAAAAYLKSRISQLIKNVMRGDTEGLSVLMFLAAICGNVTGAVGIIVRLGSWHSLLWQLPWLIGMLGTVAMDVTISLQALSSERRKQRRSSGGGEQVNGGGASSSQEALLHSEVTTLCVQPHESRSGAMLDRKRPKLHHLDE